MASRALVVSALVERCLNMLCGLESTITASLSLLTHCIQGVVRFPPVPCMNSFIYQYALYFLNCVLTCIAWMVENDDCVTGVLPPLAIKYVTNLSAGNDDHIKSIVSGRYLHHSPKVVSLEG